MSLQRRLVGPPLALAVHPAPIVKNEEKKDDTGDKRDKNDDGKDQKKDVKDEGKKDAVPDHNRNEKNAERKDGQVEVKVTDAQAGQKPPPLPARIPSPPSGDDTPGSPGSMVPEPPTPVQSAPQTPTSVNADLPQVPLPLDDKSKPAPGAPPESDPSSAPEEPLPLLRLIGPVPNRPVKTRLDLDPALPYPPVNTDPRGAYHKYAKYMQNEWILIDVTKDGWLSEQWREKPEREALAMLRGESEMRARREAERAKRNAIVRKVPPGAEAILLELWNDLVEANNHEVAVDDFWAKYDWSGPDATKHLAPVRKVPVKAKETGVNGEKVGAGTVIGEKIDGEKGDKPDAKQGDATACKPADKEVDIAKGKTDAEPIVWEDGLDDVEWTKDGLETILSRVGVQCQYNTAKPLGRNWTEPSGAYLVLSHGFFMLRTEDLLQWKSEEAANKFEMLVTSGHDRVFGNMVKAQQAEERKKKEKEYRERRMAEKRKAEEEAKRKKAASGGAAQPDDKEQKKDDALVSPKSDVKVRDGEEVVPEKAEAVAVKGDKVVVAVSVPDHAAVGEPREVKHDAEVIAAAPGEATKPEAAVQAKAKVPAEAGAKDKNPDVPKDKATGAKKDKPSKLFDPLREAELLAKMVAAGQTPPGVGIEDIKLAFKALEAAAGKDKKEKEQQAYIWTWHDSCEKWRWKNFGAGLHNVGPGGWEERDWRVFADDRGCEEFDLEESWAEEVEVDVHDWSV